MPTSKASGRREELVLDSGLAEIVRLSIVAGSEKDGSVRRTGGLHHALFWLWKGLIPMMPGAPETSLDLISDRVCRAGGRRLRDVRLRNRGGSCMPVREPPRRNWAIC